MVELERVIEAAQRHWLLRKYVNKTNPLPLRPFAVGEEPQDKSLKVLTSPRSSRR